MSELVYKTNVPLEQIEKRFVEMEKDRPALWKTSMKTLRKDVEKLNQKKNSKMLESKKKFRVNYLLKESYHYTIVEAMDEEEAEDKVFEFLGKPVEDYTSLGVEEDKTHVLQPGDDSAMAEIINKLIIDEWEAVSGYNSASVTAQDLHLEEAAKLFSDLSKEELEHVGELQQLLKSFDKNTHSIVDGEEEAKDKLDESFEELDEVEQAKVITLIDEKYHSSVDTFLKDFNSGKFDKDFDYVVSEPNNSIEFEVKDMSNDRGKVFYRYFMDKDNGKLYVYVDVK